MLFSVKDLVTQYHTDDGVVRALNGISFTVDKGETLGLVGETGAGKTTAALSIMRLLPKKIGEIVSGQIELDGRSLLTLSEAEMRAIRGRDISMIFQEPMTSLNPVMKVNAQIRESLELHWPDMPHAEREKNVSEMLEMVGIPSFRGNDYPHQFSGGMKQRVVIAMALSCQPRLLVADEPTTALDVTIQAQVLQMMRQLKERLGTSMLLITHDLGVVAQTCDKVAVMYAGQIIEHGTDYDIFLSKHHHPYTAGLFGSLPEPRTKRLSPIDGLMPPPTDLPSGCAFHPRCPKCEARCRESAPPEVRLNESHLIRCHLFGGEGL